MSSIGAPFAAIPTAQTSVRLASRDVLRTANSAAIQPPSDVPIRWTPIELQRVDHIQIEVGKIAGAIKPPRIVRRPESRMLRREHVETLRQPLEKRQPPDVPARAMQEDQRRSAAAAQHANSRAAHIQHGFRVRHLRINWR